MKKRTPEPALALTFGDGLCSAGRAEVGQRPGCSEPATHRACNRVLGKFTRWDGTVLPSEGPGPFPREHGADFCLYHANYFANAWAQIHVVIYPHLWEETWIEYLTPPWSSRPSPSSGPAPATAAGTATGRPSPGRRSRSSATPSPTGSVGSALPAPERGKGSREPSGSGRP